MIVLKRRYKINDLRFHHKNLKKMNKLNPKLNRMKKIVKKQTQ